MSVNMVYFISVGLTGLDLERTMGFVAFTLDEDEA
jgi:hypothetical protein